MERKKAHTVPYTLPEAEARLYKVVTDYVREEFSRAEALENDQRAGANSTGTPCSQSFYLGLFPAELPVISLDE